MKFKGSFVWHHHDTEDELFFFIAGRLRMDFHDREVWIGPGKMIVVPHGVEHRPHADDEVSLLLFEPRATLNIGNVVDERTVTQVERIQRSTRTNMSRRGQWAARFGHINHRGEVQAQR